MKPSEIIEVEEKKKPGDEKPISHPRHFDPYPTEEEVRELRKWAPLWSTWREREAVPALAIVMPRYVRKADGHLGAVED